MPRTKITIPIDSGSRIATRLADECDLDEVVAFLMWKSYATYSLEEARPRSGQSEEDALFDRLLAWYELELLAVPQIVQALYAPNSAVEFRSEVIVDKAAYVEQLFRAFSVTAQKSVEGMERALFW